jgi:hypothetical protein
MIRIQNFEPQLVLALPETREILMSANLTIHPSFSLLILHSSRGLAGEHHPGSDIDLSLIVDLPSQLTQLDLERGLHEVFEVTQSHWQSLVQVDLAIIFDLRRCALACFEQITWQDQTCTIGGADCFGLFKLQEGFPELVSNAGIEVKRMCPCLKIWQRSSEVTQ